MVVEDNNVVTDQIEGKETETNPVDSKETFSEKQFVIFKLADEEFGVDINEVLKIKKMEEITRIPNSANFIRGVINLRGKIVVVIDLATKLSLPVSKETEDSRIIVIEVNGSTIGMIVDEAQELLRIPNDKIDAAPKIISSKINQEYIEGVGVLGERLIVLLDLDVLIQPDIKSIESVASSVVN